MALPQPRARRKIWPLLLGVVLSLRSGPWRTAGSFFFWKCSDKEKHKRVPLISCLLSVTLPAFPQIVHSTCPKWRSPSSFWSTQQEGNPTHRPVDRTVHDLFIWQKRGKAAWSPWRDTELQKPIHTPLLARAPGSLMILRSFLITDPIKGEHVCVHLYVCASVCMCTSVYTCVCAYVYLHICVCT